MPPARHPGAALRLRHRPGDARHRRARASSTPSCTPRRRTGGRSSRRPPASSSTASARRRRCASSTRCRPTSTGSPTSPPSCAASSSRWAGRPRWPGGRPASRPTCATPGCGCSPTTWRSCATPSTGRSPTRRPLREQRDAGRARHSRSRPGASRSWRRRWPPTRRCCSRAQDTWYQLSALQERFRGDRPARRRAAAAPVRGRAGRGARARPRPARGRGRPGRGQEAELPRGAGGRRSPAGRRVARARRAGDRRSPRPSGRWSRPPRARRPAGGARAPDRRGRPRPVRRPGPARRDRPADPGRRRGRGPRRGRRRPAGRPPQPGGRPGGRRRRPGRPPTRTRSPRTPRAAREVERADRRRAGGREATARVEGPRGRPRARAAAQGRRRRAAGRAALPGCRQPVADLLTVAPGDEAALAAALGGLADAVAVSGVAEAAAALAHSRTPTAAGPACSSTGGLPPVPRDGWPVLPDGRPLGARPRRVRPRTSGRRSPARWSGSRRARPRRRRRAWSRPTRGSAAVTAGGDLSAPTRRSAARPNAPSDLEVQAAVDEAEAELTARRWRGPPSWPTELAAARQTARGALGRRRGGAGRAAGGRPQPVRRRRGAGRAGRGRPLGRGGGRAAPGRAACAPSRPASRRRPHWPTLEERLRRRRGRRRSRRSPPPRSATGCAPRSPRPGRTRWRHGSPSVPPRSGPAPCTAAPTRCAARRGRSVRRGSARRPCGPPGRAAPRWRRAVRLRRRPGARPRSRPRSPARPPSATPSPSPAPRRRPSCSRCAPASAAATAELDRLTDEVHRDEVARAEQRLRIEALEARAAEEFGVDLPTLLAEYGPDAPVPPTAASRSPRPRPTGKPAPEPVPYDRAVQEKRAAQAERELALLGKVNPLALEEFAALEERHEFLSDQLEDLKATRRDLLTVVKDVDERILEVFAVGLRGHRAGVRAGLRRALPGRRRPAGPHRPRRPARPPASRSRPGRRARRSSGCRCCPAASGR